MKPTSKILVTYEHELMPDLEQEARNITSTQSTAPGWPQKPSPVKSTGRRERSPAAQNSNNNVLEILYNVMERCPIIDVEHLLSLGTIYLIYEIAIEALHAQDDIIEFFSRTLFYFKDKVHVRLQHEEQLIINRKMHIIISAMLIMSSNVTESAEAFTRLFDPLTAVRKTRMKGDVSGGAESGLPTARRVRSSLKHRKYENDSGGSDSAQWRSRNSSGQGNGWRSSVPGINAGLHNTPTHSNTNFADNLTLSAKWLDDDYLPYIYHLMDTYDFTKQCIGKYMQFVCRVVMCSSIDSLFNMYSCIVWLGSECHRLCTRTSSDNGRSGSIAYGSYSNHPITHCHYFPTSYFYCRYVIVFICLTTY